MSRPAEKILVADEDKDIRFLFKVALRDYRVNLIEAVSADGCKDKFCSLPPDVMVINYMLEELTAYDILRQLREGENLKPLPVIMMTPEGFDLTSENPAVDDYLMKPFTKKQLLSTLKNVLGESMFKKKAPMGKTEQSNKVNKSSGEPGGKILIADDEPNIIKLLQLILGSKYELDVARSGKELVQKGLSNTYDLIMSDVIMPKASGWKSIKKLREKGCMTPVIFNSGMVRDKELYETLKPEGPSAFILKPFTTEKLLSKVAQMISRT